MSTGRKLAIYAGALVAVLAVSMGIGSAASPTGLSNARPAEAHGGQMAGAMVRGLASAEDGYRLVADAETVAVGRRIAYRFRIVGEDGPVTGFEVEHTKRMHLIVVRRDFSGFQHLHPAMSAGGTWEIPLTLTEPGAYRVFADFVTEGKKLTLATDVFVPGDFQPRPLAPIARTADAGDGYTVELTGRPVAGEESRLDVVVRRNGRTVHDLQPYLGALGHLVALRDGDLAYLHVHPDEERLSFDAEFPTPGAYRLFLQFRHDGEVRTAAFTVNAPEESR